MLVLASGIPWFLNLIDLCYYLLVLVIHDIVDNEKVTFRPGTCFTGPNKAIDVRATKRGSHFIQTCIFIISLYALLEVYCHFIRTIVADVTFSLFNLQIFFHHISINTSSEHKVIPGTKMYSLRMEESCTSRATNVRSIVFAVQMHMLSSYYTQVTHLFTITLKDVRELIPQVGKSSVPRPYSSGLSLYQLLYL